MPTEPLPPRRRPSDRTEGIPLGAWVTAWPMWHLMALAGFLLSFLVPVASPVALEIASVITVLIAVMAAQRLIVARGIPMRTALAATLIQGIAGALAYGLPAGCALAWAGRQRSDVAVLTAGTR